MKQAWIVNKISDSKAEILLYGYISVYDVKASEFVKELKQLEKQYDAIDIRINSGGGDVFEGMAIYNAIKSSKAIINAFIDGVCASMATVIAMAAKKVSMSKIAMFMTHSASSSAGGNSNDLKQQAKILDGIDGAIASIYSAKTGKSIENCKKQYMDAGDNWLTAEQALQEGLIDEIFDAEPLTLPVNMKGEEDAWNNYNTLRFAAIFNSQNKNSNMKELNLTAAMLTSIGLDDKADAAMIEAKISELSTKAAQAETAIADKLKAEKELADFKKVSAETKVTEMIDGAVKETRLTKESGEVLKSAFKDKPDELKKYIDTLKPYQSVTAQKTKPDAEIAESAKLMEMSGEELFKNGKFDRLKEINPEGYKAKYKEYFGTNPAE